MAIRSSDQITITDMTDGYSVILSSESYTFMGDTTGAPSGLSCSTDVMATCGTNRCSSVSVTQSNIACPNGISATVTNNGSNAPKVTFTTTAKISSDCEATIPVTVDGLTLNKKFSFAVAKTGATGATGGTGPQGPEGPQGPTGNTGPQGEAAILIIIESSAGTVFKNNSGSTVLTAKVYIGGQPATVASNGQCTFNGTNYGSIKWYKGSSSTALDTAATCTVSAASVTNKEVYTCKLES